MGTLAAFNSAGVTGVTASGGDGASLYGVVTDSAELASAGLDGVCTDNLVLKIDNTSGAVDALYVLGGAVGNTNAHSWKGFIRGTGTGQTLLGVGGGEHSVNHTLTSSARRNFWLCCLLHPKPTRRRGFLHL